MAAKMEQQSAPELAMACMEEGKPIAPVDVSTNSRSSLTWSDSGIQPLKNDFMPPGEESTLKVEMSPTLVQTNSSINESVEESGPPKPSDGLPMPNTSCDSESPVSPSVMKDLQFDSRFMPDAWSYEAPQNMYALLTQPTNQMDPLAGAMGIVTPYTQLQAQQHLQLQHHQQHLEQQLEHGLPLQMSPTNGFSLSSLYMSGSPLTMNPQPMMMQQQHPPNGFGINPGFPTTPTAVSLSDIMVSGDPSMFLAPSGSPTNFVKQQMIPPTRVINVKDLTLNELRPHFNKPMAVVAKELGVCITLMKKICRRNGLVRWPHRRIRSLVNRITSLQVLASNAAGAERKRFQGQIVALREELSAVIQNPNEKSRKAQLDIPRISVKADQLGLQEISEDFPISRIADEMVGSADSEKEVRTSMKRIKGKASVSIKAGLKEDADIAGKVSVEKLMKGEGPQTKKRKPSFGLHAHQPPPIKIPRHDELPSMSRLRSQSVPERKLRGDRRYGRGWNTSKGPTSSCVRPSTTTHRNGRRGSISSILNDIPE